MKHFGNFNFRLGLKSEVVRMIEDVCRATVWDRVLKEDAANFESDTFL